MVVGIKCTIRTQFTKGLQCLGLWRSSKGIEIEIFMFALCEKRFRHLIHTVAELLFGFLFPCRHFTQCLIRICQRLFNSLSTLA